MEKPDPNNEAQNRSMDQAGLMHDNEIEQAISELCSARGAGEIIDENWLNTLKTELHIRKFPEE